MIFELFDVHSKCVVSPDGKYVAVLRDSHTSITVYDMCGYIKKCFNQHHQIESFEWSANSDWIIIKYHPTCENSHSIHSINTSIDEDRNITFQNMEMVKISPDNNVVLAVSKFNKLHMTQLSELLNYMKDKYLSIIRDHSEDMMIINDIQWSPCSRKLVFIKTSIFNNVPTIFIYDFDKDFNLSKDVTEVSGYPDEPLKVKWTSDGKLIICRTYSLHIYAKRPGNTFLDYSVFVNNSKNGAIKDVFPSPDGKKLLIVTKKRFCRSIALLANIDVSTIDLKKLDSTINDGYVVATKLSSIDGNHVEWSSNSSNVLYVHRNRIAINNLVDNMVEFHTLFKHHIYSVGYMNDNHVMWIKYTKSMFPGTKKTKLIKFE